MNFDSPDRVSAVGAGWPTGRGSGFRIFWIEPSAASQCIEAVSLSPLSFASAATVMCWRTRGGMTARLL